MLTNLYKNTWSSGLKTTRFEDHSQGNLDLINSMAAHSKNYNDRVKDEEGKTPEEVLVANVGKIDPKRHLSSSVNDLMADNILQVLATMLATIVF